MNKASRQQAYKKGHRGEALAAIYLRLKGYRILERRYKTPVGEVDLIAQKGKGLVFAEVKARNTYEQGAEAITRRQQLRTIKAAKYYLRTRPEVASWDLRFDALIVLPGFKIKHIKDAWREQV
jgi:putative endonuclease